MSAETSEVAVARMLYLSLHQSHSGQGGDTHIGVVSGGLQRRGWRVSLVQPATSLSRRGPIALLRQLLGTQLAAARRLKRADLVYVRFHPLAGPLVALAGLLRTPVVIEVNGAHDDWYQVYPTLRRLDRLFLLLSRFQFRRAAAVLSVCEGLARWTEDVAGRQVPGAVIPNAADPERFRPVERSSGPYVVYAGALTPWEGVDVALEATQMSSWPRGLPLVVAGDGPLRGRVEAFAASSDLVEYVGLLPRDQVPSLVGSAAVALSPFHKPPHGASPIKLYEAMACGTPVAVSDSPGQEDLVRRTGCGIIFPAGRADLLAGAVAEILADDASASEMGRRGRRAVLAGHSWGHRLEQVDAVLTSIVTSRSGSLPEGLGQSDSSST